MASLYRPDLPTHENKPFTDKVKELSEQFHNNPIGKGVSKNIKK
jgi:hypothetical protein